MTLKISPGTPTANKHNTGAGHKFKINKQQQTVAILCANDKQTLKEIKKKNPTLFTLDPSNIS